MDVLGNSISEKKKKKYYKSSGLDTVDISESGFGHGLGNRNCQTLIKYWCPVTFDSRITNSF